MAEVNEKMLRVFKGFSKLDYEERKEVLKQINEYQSDIDSKKRLEMIKMCGDAEFRMVEGSDEFIQLEAMISGFCLINS